MLGALFLLCVVMPNLQAGGPWKWEPTADRVNRYEGLVSVESANPEFELLSFTAGIESFPASAQLKVAFYLPQASPVVVLAQELQEDKYYRMESKPAAWKAAEWNTFEPWETGVVIDAKHVSHDNIGVVVHLSPDLLASGPIAPAFVYHTTTTHRPTQYTVVIRTRSTMSRVTYTVSSPGATEPAVSRTLEGDFIRDTPIALPIETAQLHEGPAVLAITCVPTSLSAPKVERRYTFYHQR
jgi:hypothetical protein